MVPEVKIREAVSQLGGMIRQARIARGMTVDQLSQECELSHNTIENVEGGAVCTRFDTLLRLCSQLRLDPDGISNLITGVQGPSSL